jgi:hypothetical protein
VNVHQLAKFATDLFECSDMFETSNFVEMQTSGATIGYSRDQATKAEPSRLSDNSSFKFATDAAAAEFRVHIKRSFSGVLVTFAVRPRTYTSPADHLAADLRHDNGMSSAVFAKPGGAFADGLGLGIKCCGRSEDRLIVDLRDRWQVCADSAAQSHGFIIDCIPGTERRTTFQVMNLLTATRHYNLLFLSDV